MDWEVPIENAQTPFYGPENGGEILKPQGFTLKMAESWDDPLSPFLRSALPPTDELHLSVEVYENGAVCTYEREKKMLFVTPNTAIRVTFKINSGVVPDGTNVTAMVMYRDEQHRQERGAVTRCPKHLIEDLSSEGYHCSFSYHCMTSCLGLGKLKAELVTIFSLYFNGQELGKETIFTRVCSCPVRDRRRLLGDVTLQKRPCPSSSASPPPSSPLLHLAEEPLQLHSLLGVEGEAPPDEDGCFTFTWRMKDRTIFNMLQLMKAGYELSRK